MEISEINIISDFQACLHQTPSIVSRLSSMEIYHDLQFYSLWKWGAIIFAIYAALSSFAKKIKLVFIYFRRLKTYLLHQKFEQILTTFSDYEDEDDDDDISLASSSSSDEVDESDAAADDDGDDFLSRVKGSRLWLKSQGQNGHSWKKSLACNFSKHGVVRFWDKLGLKMDYDEDLISYGGSDDAVVSTWGFDSDHGEGYWSEADVPPVVLKAEGDGRGGSVVVRGFDSRMRRRAPALYGEWRSQPVEGGSRLASVFSGERVYVDVRDEAGGLMAVGDVRNMRVPLEGN